MKAFKGTLLAAALLAVVYVLVRVLAPAPEVVDTPGTQALFTFEKPDLIRVEIKRSEDSLILVETDDGWLVEGPGFRAGKSMVNRVKHQLHDLTSRATVIESPEDLALYGLGPQAIEVTLNFRDGSVQQFRAGDPNPSSVSYYIQPMPGDSVFIVKKSAVDYYSFTVDDFRERRFATFDSKAADTLTAELAGSEPLKFRRSGERTWEMLAPREMDASRDEVRGLLGRVSALKAWGFTADLDKPPSDEALAGYGLAEPRARISVGFGSRDPIVLRVGDPISEEADEDMAYVTLEGEWTVYEAKDDLLNDYGEDPDSFRNEKFVNLHHDQIVRVDVDLKAGSRDASEGEVTITRGVDTWQYDDGAPTAGSTPDRVAMRITGMRAEEFVDDAPADLAAYGLDQPRLRAVLHTEDGEQRVFLLGDEGPPRQLEEREVRRHYAAIEGQRPVYLVDNGALDVCQDLIREHGRKAERDDDIDERHKVMDEARKQDGAPEPQEPQ